MRRFLIVGCGGSGGATLSYMMDQLRSELHSAGVDKLIAGWQFVHIDVPSAADPGPDGLANVPAQGGT
jgi:Tubulin like